MPLALASSSAGLLGKAPCQADFIRINAQDASCQIFHRWLEDGMHQLRTAQAALPPGPICFAFSAPGEKNTLVGVLSQSVDQVGRDFPLCVFATVTQGAWVAEFPLAPLAFDAFFQAAAALLKDAATLGLQVLGERLRSLPLPNASAWSAAQSLSQRILQSEAMGETLSRVAEGGSPEVIYYAFRTFLLGCASASSSANGAVVLDCPIPPAGGPFLWLELARRVLASRKEAPSYFWTSAERPRALVCVGQTPAAALLYLAKPDSKSTKLWPLWTSAPGAIEAAKQALSPRQRQALERPSASVGQFLTEFLAG